MLCDNEYILMELIRIEELGYHNNLISFGGETL